MKLYNPQLEATILKSVCTLDNISAGMLLARITEESFWSNEARDAYNYIKREALEQGALPSWDSVVTSPKLSDDVRSYLQETRTKKLKNPKQDVQRLIESAEHYQNSRTLYHGCNEIIDDLAGEKPDLDELRSKLDQISAELYTNVRGVREQIQRIGKGNNTVDLVKQCLDGERIKVIPTGFRVFDEVNGGLPVGDLMVGAGPTGGGKTAIMAIQLLLNMSRFAPAVLVPLEMTKQQTMDRVLSNLSGVKINKFTSGSLTEDEKIKVRKAYAKFVKEQKANDTEYAIWDPERDVSLEEVLHSLLPYNYEVILIDYIGLLKGMDDEQQWRKLGAAARTAKIFAKTHNKTIILLAQLGDDMKVRYSKAIAEHAANAWMWQYTQAERDSGIVTIVPFKSRNQDPTPFDLAVDFSIMRAGDATEEDFQDQGRDHKGRKTKGGKKGDSELRTKVEAKKRDMIKFANDVDEYELDDDEDD